MSMSLGGRLLFCYMDINSTCFYLSKLLARVGGGPLGIKLGRGHSRIIF